MNNKYAELKRLAEFAKSQCIPYCTPDPAAVLELIAENKRLRADRPTCMMGVGDGSGDLFVRGNYDSIKAAQAICLERDQLKVEVEAPARDCPRA